MFISTSLQKYPASTRYLCQWSDSAAALAKTQVSSHDRGTLTVALFVHLASESSVSESPGLACPVLSRFVSLNQMEPLRVLSVLLIMYLSA